LIADRHHARILAMQLLCQADVQGGGVLDQADGFLADSEASSEAVRYARHLARACWQQRREINRRIREKLEHWRLERLSPVERNVIRVAVAELDAGEVPSKVVIDEAVEIGREFGGQQSPSFINGVLDAVWSREEGTAE